jgi:hypothetical protein
MSTRRTICLAGVLLLVSALAQTGCGGGAAPTGPNGEYKGIPATNPAPGTVPLEDEYKSQKK